MMTNLTRSLALAVMLLADSAVRAHADATCVQRARTDMVACVAQCRDDFRSARFTCRGIDPTCGKACLAGRQACVDDVADILTTGQLPGGGTLANCAGGTDQCRSDLRAARTACGAPCNANPTCDACVDAAQVTAFVCRDTCRESWRRDATVHGLLEACRVSFRACVAQCPRL